MPRRNRRAGGGDPMRIRRDRSDQTVLERNAVLQCITSGEPGMLHADDHPAAYNMTRRLREHAVREGYRLKTTIHKESEGYQVSFRLRGASEEDSP